MLADLREAMLAGPRCRTVVAWCNHGKHRSVAVAELLSTLFETRGVHHLNRRQWRCHGCDMCGEPTAANRRAVAAAWAACWRRE